jgi:hypothetical protein
MNSTMFALLVYGGFFLTTSILTVVGIGLAAWTFMVLDRRAGR